MLEEPTMTIVLELPPDAEASLIAQAKACGLSLDAFLQIIITTQASAGAQAQSMRGRACEEDLDRAIDELFDTVQVPPGVGEGVMRRENWYR